MRRAAVLCVGLVAAYGVPHAVAQERHDETVIITGTIQAINSDRILIETRDDVSFQLKRVWVATTQDTKYKRGKTRIEAEATQLTKGEPVIAVATRENTDDYSLRLVALDIELSRARRTRLLVKRSGGEVLSIVITEKTLVPDNEKRRDRKDVGR